MGQKRDAARRRRSEELEIRRLPLEQRDELRRRASYEGSPFHKKEPNNFGLTPPSAPRPDKTLCDEAGILDAAVARALFRRAIEVGLASQTMAGVPPFPKRLWAVSDSGQVFEAIYGGSREGAYHGYPVRSDDPLSSRVREHWRAAMREESP